MAEDVNIGIHPRVHRRHPEVSDDDVRVAMKTMICYKQRPTGEWLAIGVDSKSRMLEIVYEYDDEEDYFFVYHAMIPPSVKSLRELCLAR